MMKSTEFVAKAIDIAKNFKTLYVMGCFGAPMTSANKARYTQNHAYNKQAARTAMIQAATADTFGFDCVCLIKGILWGWTGDTSKTYGGAGYKANGVPDIGADTMIQKCPDASATGWDKIVPGEVVWMEGHIGIYVGDGLAVECTPKWDNKVQITAVGNIGKKAGYNTRTWKKHGHLPYVDYTVEVAPAPQAPAPTNGRFNAVSEMPGYAQPTIKKMIDKGIIGGTGTGKKDDEGRPADLDLSLDMVRVFVTNDRAGLYD